MIFRFWKKKPRNSQLPGNTRTRSTARFGGMQERVLQARLEILVDAVLTRHRSVIKPASALAEFSLVEQEKFLASVDRISLLNQEFALQFCYLGIPALTELDDASWEPWIDRLLVTFNNKGMDAGKASITSYRSYQQEQKPGASSVAFTEITRVLEIFVQALNGRKLKLASSTQSYTDTETLFLPTHINRFKTRDENFRLYKALLIHQWAQTWFGTWRIDLAESIKEYPDTERALQLFHQLETLRLDACIKRELPGIAREMALLRNESTDTHPLWVNAQADLQKPDADVHTSLAHLSQLYLLQMVPQEVLYQGQLRVTQTTDVISKRGNREQTALQEKLSELRNTMSEQTPDSTQQSSAGQAGFSVAQPKGDRAKEYPNTLLEYDGTAVEIMPQLQAILDSISQDYGEIPQSYLDKTETNEVREEAESSELLTTANNNHTHDFSYDEWDHSRQRYRNNWCLLHEESVKPIAGAFVRETLNKYQVLLKKLRRSFEALRQENRQLKREPFGDNIDIDAVVEAWSDTHHGLEASERLFIQTRREDRNVAVMFMIDMSASTTGWVNRVERESLVLLCEALELLGDRYAIYGFSGHSNNYCQCFHIKDFDENYSDEVRNRIEGIQPQDYTRMGAAIRHLGRKLSREEARTRLLITLSDGKPDDTGGYRGRYGIEDTRMALIEIKHLGIKPYCITIDTNARKYLPYMFGKYNFTIINHVDELPQRITDIYRRLTH